MAIIKVFSYSMSISFHYEFHLSFSSEIIREVKKNGDRLTQLLKCGTDKLEPDCLNRALIAATRTENNSHIGKLIMTGATNIKECLEVAIAEKKTRSRAMLLLIRASFDGNKDMVKKLFSDPTVNESKLDLGEFDDDQFPDVQHAVKSGDVSTTVAIDIARRYSNRAVREELLARTGINQEESIVSWHGLRLRSLEISWIRRISWVKQLRLARNDFKSLPCEIEAYLKQV